MDKIERNSHICLKLRAKFRFYDFLSFLGNYSFKVVQT